MQDSLNTGGLRVIFLDIDGVLNSYRTYVAFGGFPHDLVPEHRQRFDEISISLLRNLCLAENISIVVSSSWRAKFKWQEIGEVLGLPAIGETPSLATLRGEEIAAWLVNHPEVEQYAILDDRDEMLPKQSAHFVHTNAKEGISYGNFVHLCHIFGTDPIAVHNVMKERGCQKAESNDEIAVVA